jgi:asparagine synthase (glutamine-hydrolysing)
MNLSHRLARAHHGIELLMWNGTLHERSSRAGADAPDGLSGDAAYARDVYAREGVQGLGGLIGDWSLVLWHEARRVVVLASDYVGNRPLYYAVTGDAVQWGTSQRELAARIGATEPDTRFIAAFLKHGGLPGHTPYKAIKSVPPGHAVIVGRDVTVVPLWKLPTHGLHHYAAPGQYHDEFKALLEEAVAVRMRSPQPVAVELSGGLDSTAVTALAARLVRNRQVAATGVTTMSYVFPSSADARFIRIATDALAVTNTQIPLSGAPLYGTSTPAELLPTPSSPIHVAASAVAQQAGASGVLTGQLGDLVCGNFLDDSLQLTTALRRGRLADALTAGFAWSRATGTPVLRIVANAVRQGLAGGRAGAAGVGGDTQHLARPELLSREGVAGAEDVFSADWKAAPPDQRTRGLMFTMMRELRVLQAPAAFGPVAYTHPFSHRPLVEFLMRVPAGVLCAPGEPRKLMRAALAGTLPAEIQHRRSKAFFGSQVIAALRPMAREFGPARTWRAVEGGWVCATRLSTALDELACGLGERSMAVRQAVLLERWLREESLDRPPRPVPAPSTHHVSIH